MLEEGKIYIVKVDGCNVWLFKKYKGALFADKQTGCYNALYLKDMEKYKGEGYVGDDSEIEWIKPANENYIAIWNREFDDNVELR